MLVSAVRYQWTYCNYPPLGDLTAEFLGAGGTRYQKRRCAKNPVVADSLGGRPWEEIFLVGTPRAYLGFCLSTFPFFVSSKISKEWGETLTLKRLLCVYVYVLWRRCQALQVTAYSRTDTFLHACNQTRETSWLVRETVRYARHLAKKNGMVWRTVSLPIIYSISIKSHDFYMPNVL